MRTLKNIVINTRDITPFRRILRSICPKPRKDSQLAPLDCKTPARFDNKYFVIAPDSTSIQQQATPAEEQTRRSSTWLIEIPGLY
jgi:hypothetical protein